MYLKARLFNFGSHTLKTDYAIVYVVYRTDSTYIYQTGLFLQKRIICL